MHTSSPDTAKVQLGRVQSEALLHEAVSRAPEECCGVLLGVEEGGTFRISKTVPVVNRAIDRQRTFSIAATDVGQYSRQARKEGCELLGFYHSHPSGPAYPSQRDIAEATAFAGMLHLIIGLGGSKEVKAWCTAPANWMQLELQRGG
jgi:desampylase